MKRLLFLLSVIFLAVGCGKEEVVDYTEEYQELENIFLEAASTMINSEDNSNLLPKEEGQVYSIALRNLYNGNYIKAKLIDPDTKEECNEESFVHVQMVNGELVYTIKLMCGTYTTP